MQDRQERILAGLSPAEKAIYQATLQRNLNQAIDDTASSARQGVREVEQLQHMKRYFRKLDQAKTPNDRKDLLTGAYAGGMDKGLNLPKAYEDFRSSRGIFYSEAESDE